MTAVFAFRREGVPIVLADILLTARGQQLNAEIPSVLDAIDTKQSDFFLWGVCRKVFRLGDRCAIAFSCCDFGRAQLALKTLLQSYGACSPAHLEQISNCLKPYRSSQKDHYVGLVGWLYGEKLECFSWTTDEGMRASEGPEILGSGSSSIRDFTDRTKSVKFSSSEISGATDQARAQSLSLVSRILGRELHDHSTAIEHRYGGGLQTLIWNPASTRFEWLDDALIFFWRVNLDNPPNESFGGRKVALRYYVEGDRLNVHRLELAPNPTEGTIRIERQWDFAIPDPWDAAQLTRKTSSSRELLSCSTVCHAITWYGGRLTHPLVECLIDLKRDDTTFAKIAKVDLLNYRFELTPSFREAVNLSVRMKFRDPPAKGDI